MGDEIGNEGVMRLLPSVLFTFPPSAAHLLQSPVHPLSTPTGNGSDCLPFRANLHSSLSWSFIFLHPQSNLFFFFFFFYLAAPPHTCDCQSPSSSFLSDRQWSMGGCCVQWRQQWGSTGPWNAGNTVLRDYRAELRALECNKKRIFRLRVQKQTLEAEPESGVWQEKTFSYLG